MSKFSNNELFFIIEEAQFNLGNFDKAIQMIEAASLTGANAIEFQLAFADDFYIKSDPGYTIYMNREFTDEQLEFLVTFSHSKGLEFVATCLSYRLVGKMAAFGADIFNINASDINNPKIIDEVVKTRKPFMISIPLANKKEIEWVYNRIVTFNEKADFVFLHGQHPMASGEECVHIEDTALGVIDTITKQYGKKVGFIDHTNQVWMPSIAVAAGAKIVTKHLTLSHLYNGPDHTICLNPEEMRSAINNAREVFSSLQVRDKELAKGEDLDRTVMRRSIVTARDILKGTIIKASDIEFKRPGSGISPENYKSVIGKIASTNISADILLTYNMLENGN